MLRNIFDNVQVGVELYDKEGCLVDINTKNLDIFGIAAKEDVLGINFFENPIVPEEIRRNVRNGQEQSFRLDYPFDRLGGYYPSRKKGSVQIYTKVTMLYGMSGELVNFLVLNIDNTEINEAHNRLEEFESSFSLVSRFGKVGYARFDLVTRDGVMLLAADFVLDENLIRQLRELEASEGSRLSVAIRPPQSA
jgi:PAS domain S-box-containing protein